MANGRFLAPSGRRLVAPSGRRVWSTPTTPCCCGGSDPCDYTTCVTAAKACNCQAVPGIFSAGAVCCEKNSGSVSITFPTFTPADGWESEDYADTFSDFMDEVSGQTLTFALDGINRGYRFQKFGKITQIVDCTAKTWHIDVYAYYDDQASYDMKFNIVISVASTDTGGPWEIGDDFPCTDEDGNPTAWYHIAGDGTNFLGMFTDATGNCDGPTENLLLDAIDVRYIDEETYEVTPWTLSSDCGPTDNSGFPSSFDFALSQLYAGLPSITINNVGSFGNSDLRYGGSGGGVVGDIVWSVYGLELWPRGRTQTPGEGCTVNEACCFEILGYLEVTDWTDPENPVVVLEQFIDAFKCGDAENIFGSYTQISELGGGSLTVSETP